MDSFITAAAILFDYKVHRQSQHTKHAQDHPDSIHPRVALVDDDRESVRHPESYGEFPSAGNRHFKLGFYHARFFGLPDISLVGAASVRLPRYQALAAGGPLDERALDFSESQTASLCQLLPYCAAFANASNIRSMASVCNYPDCTGRILESERPLFPLRVILFFNECRQSVSSHKFLREALQLSIRPFKRLLGGERLPVTSKQVINNKNSEH